MNKIKTHKEQVAFMKEYAYTQTLLGATFYQIAVKTTKNTFLILNQVEQILKEQYFDMIENTAN